MIQQVVPGRDGSEHLTHRARGGLRIGGAFRGGTEDREFG